MRKPCSHKKVVSLHREKTNPRIERGRDQDLVGVPQQRSEVSVKTSSDLQ
jgi:hypothetical protein